MTHPPPPTQASALSGYVALADGGNLAISLQRAPASERPAGEADSGFCSHFVGACVAGAKDAAHTVTISVSIVAGAAGVDVAFVGFRFK